MWNALQGHSIEKIVNHKGLTNILFTYDFCPDKNDIYKTIVTYKVIYKIQSHL